MGHWSYQQCADIGSNYLVSVKEVMQSEMKLKIRGLLRLFTGTRGVVSVKEFVCSFSEIEKGKQDTAFIHAFPYCDMDMETMDVSELLMVTGCIAKNTIARTSCKSCKVNLGSVGKPVNLFVEEVVGQYFDLINRGGLTYPSNLLFNVAQYAYLMFNVSISSVECTFLEVAHQKQTFLGVIEQFITNNEECKEILIMCEECKQMFLVYIMKAMSCFTNVLLNNYSKDKSDDITIAKMSRKLSKFD